jgi:hypothetical protein
MCILQTEVDRALKRLRNSEQILTHKTTENVNAKVEGRV